MNRSAAIMMVIVAAACLHALSGCSGSDMRYLQATDEEVVESLSRDTIVNVQWYGNNQWRLTENGWDGGGHSPYDVHLNTDDINRCAHGRLVWGDDERLLRNPRLLYPLFDSPDTDVVLAALYCYSRTPIHGYMTAASLLSTADAGDLGSQLRKLLDEHRDVRVRCMAADMLRSKSFLTIIDSDRMLSDENLSVKEIGIRSVSSVRNGLQSDEHKLFTAGARPAQADVQTLYDTYYPVKNQLIPVLLKHLNDNHFYIRASCYSDLRFLTQRRRYLPGGRMTIDTPDMLAKRFEWERESWWNCRDQRRKLLSWWRDNGESILRDFNAEFSDSTVATATP